MGRNGTKKEHLPIYGVGPLYVYTITAPTAAAVFCRKLSLFAAGRLSAYKIPLTASGILLIALGMFMWIQAVVVSKVDEGIKENRLVRTGIYAWVRNPVYSAFMIIYTGVILMAGNAFFFVLPFLYWLFMTVLMKHTEERWLLDLYGQEYIDYCKHVNRCIPWFPKGRKAL